tara:strand:+ start:286 stop:900 length:615 start_codon:yes stop_codon:yes gene_type:complete
MNNKTKNITILIAIALTVLSFQVKAQVQLYGCTDPNATNYYANPNAADDGSCLYFDSDWTSSHGWSTTAVVQMNSPSISVFVFDQVRVKFRVVGSTVWNQVHIDVDPVTPPLTIGGFADSSALSMWVFPNFMYNSIGEAFISGGRHIVNVRLVGLLSNTDYEVKMMLSGNSLIDNNTLTQELSDTFNTQGTQEAPFPERPVLFQ